MVTACDSTPSFPLVEGLAQVSVSLARAFHGCELIGIEQMVAVPARLLREIHGLVGVAQQQVGICLVLRVQGYANTCGNIEQRLGGGHRSGSRLQQAEEHRFAVTWIRQIDQYRDELVAADACQGIPLTQGVVHVARDADQQFVASFMAVLVIDCLETVEVEVDHCQRLAAALALRHGLVQAVGEQFMENDEGNTFDRRIPSFVTADVKIQHRFGALSASLGINNLFDKSPPFLNGDSIGKSNTIAGPYDVTGRFFFARISTKF